MNFSKELQHLLIGDTIVFGFDAPVASDQQIDVYYEQLTKTWQRILTKRLKIRNNEKRRRAKQAK